jgi:lipoprotein-releasing system permease protein
VYQALLTRKYLTRKIMPMLAMVAVMLSVATILVTWSVMGGFLVSLIQSGRVLVGDVAIVWPNVGFGHYDDLIEMLEEDPMIDAATPIIETFGLVQLPDGRIELIQIKGVDALSYSDVTGFADTLWWKPITEPTPKDRNREDLRLIADELRADVGIDLAQIEVNGLTLTRPDDETGIPDPAGVLGVEVTGLNYRTRWGGYEPQGVNRAMSDGRVSRENVFMPHNGSVALTVLSLDSDGRPVDPKTITMPIANEFQSGLYEVDQSTIVIPLAVLQRNLRMDEAQRVTMEREPFATEIDPETGVIRPKMREVIGIDPARVTTVLVKKADDTELEPMRERVRAIYAAFARKHQGEVPSAHDMHFQIKTWEDLNRTMISAVKKETGLVLFIFGIVSFTTVFLVLAIFWSMASEKTKDIGILRALGASTLGIVGPVRRHHRDRWRIRRYGPRVLDRQQHQRDPRLDRRAHRARDLGPPAVLLHRDPQRCRSDQGAHRLRGWRDDLRARCAAPRVAQRPHGPGESIEV